MRWFGEWGGLTKGREGYFILFRFIFLIGLYLTAFYLTEYLWLKILLTTVVGYLIVEMVLLPSAIAFGGILPMRPLRALVFVFLDYISISLAFGTLYITLCRSSFNVVPRPHRSGLFQFHHDDCLGIGRYNAGEAHSFG